jgi:hypothetical protein
MRKHKRWLGYAALVVLGAAVAVPSTLVVTEDPPDIGSLVDWVGTVLTLAAVLAALFIPMWQRREQDRDRHLTGLDEVRRLLYLALLEHCRDGLVSTELAASIGNALAHQHPEVLDPERSLDLMFRLCDGSGRGQFAHEDRAALVALIAAVTEQRGDPVVEPSTQMLGAMISRL